MVQPIGNRAQRPPAAACNATVGSVSERILIVEDEANIASFVAAYLQKAGYQVDRAHTGTEGIEKARSLNPAVIVLDLNLPDMDGLEVCRTLRADGAPPILMLTARDDDVDKIVGLEIGADDYMTKPFNPRELVARIRSILRRSTTPAPKTKGRKTHGSIVIDAGRRECTVAGEHIQLAPKEFDLFWELLDHSGIVLTRDQLLERVWGYTFAGDTRTVDVHVRQLRRKIGDTCPVVTVWGVGYKVADDAPVA
jgi:DNA-binding response OmpR family regulator